MMADAVKMLETSPAKSDKSSTTDVARKDLRPMHGILSMHGRTNAETWSCLVCGACQPLSHDVCSICSRDRVPSWLFDANGCAVLPGSIVRCPRASAAYHPPPPPPPPHPSGPSAGGHGNKTPTRSREKSPTTTNIQAASSTPRTRPGAAAKHSSSPHSPAGYSGCRSLAAGRENAVNSPVNGTSPGSRAGSSAVSQPPTTPSSSPRVNYLRAQGGGVVLPIPRRGGQAPAEVTFEAAIAATKEKFEGLSGDCSVLVVAVNGVQPQPPRVPRSVEGYCIMEGDDGQAKSRTLVKVVLSNLKETLVEVVDSSADVKERQKFIDFGLCGRCERTYRIDQGWKHVSAKPRGQIVLEGEAKLRNLRELAAKTQTRKTALRAKKGSPTAILEESERLKRIYGQIAETRRFLEPLVISCPFCLWNCAPLFLTDA